MDVKLWIKDRRYGKIIKKLTGNLIFYEKSIFLIFSNFNILNRIFNFGEKNFFEHGKIIFQVPNLNFG